MAEDTAHIINVKLIMAIVVHIGADITVEDDRVEFLLKALTSVDVIFPSSSKSISSNDISL